MSDKVTSMVVKADLQCRSCYKKVKKLLSKFPEIRDEIYDEKQNTVTITVMSCCPEKIRDKLCCKGGKTIKIIDIENPKEPEKKPKEPEKKKKEVTEKLKETAKDGKADKPPTTPTEKPSKDAKKPPEEEAAPPVAAVPIHRPPNPNVGSCFGQCYNDYGHCGYGRPVPSYGNYGYGPYGCCDNRGPYWSQCGYFSEEHPSECKIM